MTAFEDRTESPDANVKALAEQLNRLGCEEGAKHISNLLHCLALFRETLAEKINPEIGSFDRYFLMTLEFCDNILHEFRNIATFLKAIEADKEETIAERLRILDLKTDKETKDHDEIFEKSPRLQRIQEARTKTSEKMAKIKKAIRMIREETMSIALREGYQTDADFARAKYNHLALKKSKEHTSLDAAMRDFEEACMFNQKILDRFEKHSIQHKRHFGHNKEIGNPKSEIQNRNNT